MLRASHEYRFGPSLKRRVWASIAIAAAAPTIVIVLGVLGLDLWTTVIFALVFALGAGYVAWAYAWLLRNLAESVVVDESGIEAKPIYGDPVRIAWDDVVVRQEHERRDPLRGMFPQMRLVAADARSRIVLDGEMPGFEELVADICARTPHASSTDQRRWWERVFLPG
jgi:hypothetical protein